MEYKKIEVRDKSIIQEFYDKTTQWFSEYTFSTHVAWNTGGYEYRYRVEDDTLYVIVEKLSAGRPIMLKPICLKSELAPEDLSVIAGREGIDLFLCIDQHYLETFNRDEWEEFFEIGEDRRWGNYYYLSRELAEFKGSKFSKKRNLVKQFIREYSGDRVEVKRCSGVLIRECIKLHEKWYEEKGDYDNKMINREISALRTSLNEFKSLGLEGIGLFMKDELKAFAIYERLNAEAMVVHFEKVVRGYKGLPQYFLSRTAEIVRDEYKYINREGDMDDSGLRQAKQSNRPVFIERSYRLRLR